jgi:DNA-binding IclR family transcriptional regulator
LVPRFLKIGTNFDFCKDRFGGGRNRLYFSGAGTCTLSITAPMISRTPSGKRKARSPRSAAGNRSVVVGVHLLKSIAALPGPASLGEIAKVAGLSASRTHRFLAGLIQTGLVEQNESTGRYELGATIVELGLIALGRTDAVKIGSEALTTLTERTGLVSLLSTWGSNGPTLVKWEPGRLQTAVRLREGRNLPLLTTATGRVFLAYMPAGESRPLLDRELKARNADKARALSSADVQALRDKVLRRRLGQSSGEENPGLTALAAPVFDHEGRIALVMTVVGILGTFSTEDDGEPARVLKATADQLSRRLGAPQTALRGTPAAAGALESAAP